MRNTGSIAPYTPYTKDVVGFVAGKTVIFGAYVGFGLFDVRGQGGSIGETSAG